MSATVNLYKGDWGHIFTFTVKDENNLAIDISTATSKTITFDTGKNVFIRSLEFVSGGTTGKVKYTTIAGDLDITGYYKVQLNITMPSGHFTTSEAQFNVVNTLDAKI
jgi:hypothetical protein